jgi:hypothetical protein
MNESTAERVASPGFEIRVRGILGSRLVAAFPDLVAVIDRGDTVLKGRLPDQSALHGVLAQIEALGLELVEVRRRRSPATTPTMERRSKR